MLIAPNVAIIVLKYLEKCCNNYPVPVFSSDSEIDRWDQYSKCKNKEISLQLADTQWKYFLKNNGKYSEICKNMYNKKKKIL